MNRAIPIIGLMIQRSSVSWSYCLSECLLFVCGLALACLVRMDFTEYEEAVDAISIPCAFLVNGTAIGGLFGKMAQGAASGMGLFCAYFVWVLFASGFR